MTAELDMLMHALFCVFVYEYVCIIYVHNIGLTVSPLEHLSSLSSFVSFAFIVWFCMVDLHIHIILFNTNHAACCWWGSDLYNYIGQAMVT